MWRYGWAVLVLALIGGCESNHEYLLKQGYQPAFVDGFDAGCVSGRQVAGSISGEYRKDVPRYLKDPQYAEGWNDVSASARACWRTRSAMSTGNVTGTNGNVPGSRRRTVTRLGLIARNKSFSANRPGQKPATMVHRSL